MHPLVRQQFDTLNAIHPKATISELPSGALIVIVPDVAIPERWTPRVVTVGFALPPGFPAACPADFWTVEEVMTENGSYCGNPYATDLPMRYTLCGYDGPVGTFWSWRLQAWNPNTDGIVRWFNTIRRRFAFERETVAAE